VCRSWRGVFKDPWMWRSIDLRNRRSSAKMKQKLDIMCRHVVDRSQGGLAEIKIWNYGSNGLLNYIADRFHISLFFHMTHTHASFGFLKVLLISLVQCDESD
ncbi:predicted protein, partial [Arabidopsis lyrata subsp. lyrata]